MTGLVDVHQTPKQALRVKMGREHHHWGKENFKDLLGEGNSELVETIECAYTCEKVQTQES